MHTGVPQERGRSCRLHPFTSGMGGAGPESSRPGDRRRVPRETRRQARGMVPPSEGNEVRRDGRQEVGALRSTVEAGESLPWETPWKEGNDPSMEPLKGNTTDAPTFESVSTKQQRIAELARQSPQTSFTTASAPLRATLTVEARWPSMYASSMAA